MRDALVRTISGLADKDNQDVDARLRRKSFQVLGDIYWLFGGDMFHSSKGVNRHSLYMTCPEATQAECESFVCSELDLWGEKVREKAEALRAARTPKAGTGEAGTDANPEGDDDRAEKDTENAELLEDEKLAAALIEQEDKYEMFGTVFSFMRQIILKDFSMEHATAVVAQYGRFGAEFDEGVKRVVAALKAQTTSGASRQANQQKTEVFMSVCMASLKQVTAPILFIFRVCCFDNFWALCRPNTCAVCNYIVFRVICGRTYQVDEPGAPTGKGLDHSYQASWLHAERQSRNRCTPCVEHAERRNQPRDRKDCRL